MAKEYPVRTLAQMALIPEDAIPRFLAEFPDMLFEMRRLLAIKAEIEAMTDGAGTLNIEEAGDPMWIDDGKGIGSVTIGMGDGESLTITRDLRARQESAS